MLMSERTCPHWVPLCDYKLVHYMCSFGSIIPCIYFLFFFYVISVGCGD